MSEKKSYRVGDRVRFIKSYAGVTGTIVRLDTGPNVWVRPDDSTVRIGAFEPGEPGLVGTNLIEPETDS